MKPKNEVFARHLLATRKQEPSENVDQFYQQLLHLSKDCQFKAVTADNRRNEYIRDSFISGLTSTHIRQRLLENNALTLQEALQQARSLESAQTHASLYVDSSKSSLLEPQACASAELYTSTQQEGSAKQTLCDESSDRTCAAVRASRSKFSCYFCGGNNRHKRSNCPAKDSACSNCAKRGHFAKVCLSNTSDKSTAMMILGSTNMGNKQKSSVKKAAIDIKLNDTAFKGLIDTGSSNTFISAQTVNSLNLELQPCISPVSLASADITNAIEIVLLYYAIRTLFILISV